MAFRSTPLRAAGGFDSRYRGASVGEDIEISLRLTRSSGPNNVLALVGGALIVHSSTGTWKDGSRRLGTEIVATHYWYRKNLPHTLQNAARYLWMCCGILLFATGSALRRRNLQPLRSVLAGVRCISSEYADADFLRPA